MPSIAVGADDAGAPLKERLAAYLRDHGKYVRPPITEQTFVPERYS